MGNLYYKGQTVRLSVEFKTPEGVYVDPATAVWLRWLTPANVASGYHYGVDIQLVKDAVGKYHADLTLNLAGYWHFRWEGTDPVFGVAFEWSCQVCEPAWPLW